MTYTDEDDSADFGAAEPVASQASTDKESRAKSLRSMRWSTRLLPGHRRKMREFLHQRCVDTEGGEPWFGRGLLFAHYTPSFGTMVSLCWRPMDGTSNTVPRTLIGHTCGRCRRIWRRTVRAWLAHPETNHRPGVAKISRAGAGTGHRRGEKILVCITCQKADSGDRENALWPCSHASTEQIDAAQRMVEIWETEQQRQRDWRVVYEATYTTLTGHTFGDVADGKVAIVDFAARQQATQAADAAHPHPADRDDDPESPDDSESGDHTLAQQDESRGWRAP